MDTGMFRPPGGLNFDVNNVAENWRIWRQKFEVFVEASGNSGKSSKMKVSMLLNLIGDQGLEIYNTFKLAEEKKDDINEVISQFEIYCAPRKNVVYERFKFFSCSKKEGQAFDLYLTELKKAAKQCEFGDQEDSLIRDRIVMGVNDTNVQERLLREPNLTLEKAADFCRASEISKLQVKTMQEKLSIDTVQTKAKGGYKDSDRNKRKDEVNNDKKDWSKKNNEQTQYYREHCKKCGYVHSKERRCPAQGKTCLSCQQKNHFARVCQNRSQTKKVHEVMVDSSSDSEQENELYVYSITKFEKEGQEKFWAKDITVENKIINFKLDCGAETSTISRERILELDSNKKIMKSDIVLVALGNHRIKPLGTVILQCSTNKVRNVDVKFCVVDLPDHKPLLGLDACRDLNLIRRIDELGQQYMTKDDIIKKYSSVFKGLGGFPGNPHHIELKQGAIPRIHPTRRIPVGLHNRLKQTLDELVQRGIVSKLHRPTDWVNSLVIVEKQNGNLRLCLDPKDLNAAIKREHYPIPTADELVTGLCNKKVFSVLDLKDGFWHVPLDESSAELCTFGTPFGRYRFNRLPFGICSAPEVFQQRNSEIFSDIEGVQVYFDDIIIAGVTTEEHNERLRRVLDRARDNGIKFNKEKFQYAVQSVRYVGQLISADGIRPDPEQVKAVVEMETPTNRAALLRFLGMVKYLSKFVPNMSNLTAPLRELTKEKITWQWNREQDGAIEKIKKVLSNAPVLKYYDTKKDLNIQTDASRDGLGACLLQEGHPIAFASRSLTECEQRYAQIEKEMLAIVFAAEKFHQFIYGRQVLVHSDHKPLEAIFGKDLNRVSARLQRMLLRLLKYELCVKYLPGSQMYLADTLSRAFLKDKVQDDPEMLYIIHSIIQELPMTEERRSEFKRATSEDETLKMVTDLHNQGWPDKNGVPKELRHYWKVKHELSVIDGLVFLGKKLVVPARLRPLLLRLLHESHLGMVKCKARARESFYWPGLTNDIEEMVAKCQICEKFSCNNYREPMKPHPIPSRPWEKIAADILEFGNKSYLTVMDYHSKWIELLQLRDKTAREVIMRLKAVFSHQGIPDILVTDNMPFNSREVKAFAKEWDFTLITTSPRYPQSNGLAEKSVKICKDMLKKNNEEGKDVYVSLLEYRNTPIAEIGLSPAQMLMSRRLKDKMPTHRDLLKPKLQHGIIGKLRKRQKKQKYHFDKGTRKLSTLKDGSNIVIRKPEGWEPAIVIKKHETPRSYWVQDSRGQIYRRNRKHLAKSKNPILITGTDVEGPSSDNTATGMDETNEEQEHVSQQEGVRRSGRIVRTPVKYKDYIMGKSMNLSGEV